MLFNQLPVDAAFYLGKRDDNGPKDTSVTQQTVLSLLEPLKGLHHKAYFDNYYTSIPLLIALYKMNIFCTGTIRVNRKGLCKEVTVKKGEESNLKKNPGYCRYATQANMVYAAWFDKRPVHLLSNCHGAHGTVADSSVQHWYSTSAGKVLLTVYMPFIVKEYNLYMGAVDRFDQFRSYVGLDMRSTKFWHPMMWFIIESSLVNAWVLYRATREKAGLPLQYDHFSFRRAIALALAAEWEDMGVFSITALPSLRQLG